MELCRLCIIWERKVQPLPSIHDLHSWGPSEEDKKKCIEKEFGSSWDEDGGKSDISDTSDSGEWEDDHVT